MKFDRRLKDQIITFYDHALMKHNWGANGIPFEIGEWYLLAGLGPSAVEYPLEFAAIYVDSQDEQDPSYIYVELTEDTIMKLVVAKSVTELSTDLPKRALEALNAVNVE